MKKLLTTKFFIAVIFFCAGFLTNHLLTKFTQAPTTVQNGVERFPVDPEDFDHNSMLDTINRMNEKGEDGMHGVSGIGAISQREDEKFVYYEIPLADHNGINRKLNVEIKNGMVRVTEAIKANGNAIIETSSERIFTIAPELDGDRAEVVNTKDKIIIKIPKINK